MTCDIFDVQSVCAYLFLKGECVGPNDERCDDAGCRASKTVCESKGFTYRPLTQSMIDRDMQSVPQELSACCGGSANVKSPFSFTQYVRDGYVNTIPPPGTCVRDGCCGEGTA